MNKTFDLAIDMVLECGFFNSVYSTENTRVKGVDMALDEMGVLFNSFVNRIIGTAVGTVLAVVGFAVAAYIINFVSRSLYNADVTFEELVRTLGLAYVWNVIGFAGILGAFSAALSCLLAPALVVGVLLGLVAWFVAAKEALDLDWGETIISVIVGWIVMALISIILSGVIYSALGLTQAVARGLFGS